MSHGVHQLFAALAAPQSPALIRTLRHLVLIKAGL
jgi:hypothetical protein